MRRAVVIEALAEMLRGKAGIVFVKVSRQVSNAGREEHECPMPADRSDVNSEEQVNSSAQKAFSLSMVEQRQLDQFLVDRPCKLRAGDLAIRAQSHHGAFGSLALYTKN